MDDIAYNHPNLTHLTVIKRGSGGRQSNDNLVDLVRNLPYLTYLKIHEFIFFDDPFKVCQIIRSSCRRLTEVHYQGIPSDDTMGALCYLPLRTLEINLNSKGTGLANISYAKDLTHVELCGGNLEAETITHLSKCPRLESLTICNCNRINLEGYAALADMKSLRILKLFEIFSLEGSLSTLKFSNIDAIHTISISRCRIKRSDFFNVLGTLKQVQHLEVDNSVIRDDQELLEFAKLVPHLKSLKISVYYTENISPEGVIGFLEKSPHISLEVSFRNYKQEIVNAFKEKVEKELQAKKIKAQVVIKRGD